MNTMRKIARTQLRAWTLQELTRQGGICLVCNTPIDHTIPREAVADHDHNTGEIRGVLHRSCNGALGKVDNAAGRWGAKSMEYSAIIAFLERMLAYYKKPGLGVMYPTHKTEDEKRLARNAKARKTRAATAARRAVRSMPKKGS